MAATLKKSRWSKYRERIEWLSPFVGGPMAAAAYLATSKYDKAKPRVMRHNGEDFVVRRADIQVIKEVLYSQEYGFLSDILIARATPRVLDLGAHIGSFALWCQSQNPATQLLSIEASPDTFAVLARNAEMARARGRNWTVANAAAAARDGLSVRMDEGLGTMSRRVSERGGTVVPGRGLGSLLDEIAPDGGRVDVLKVDIEGSEAAFLLADPAALARADAIVVELHPELCDAAAVTEAIAAAFPVVEAIRPADAHRPLVFGRRPAP